MKNHISILAIITSAALFALPTFAFASFDQDLRQGDSGQSVTEMQTFLAGQGDFTASPTGTFGPRTHAAVMSFQERNNIAPTAGFWGRITRAFANSLAGGARAQTSLPTDASSLLALIAQLQAQLATLSAHATTGSAQTASQPPANSANITIQATTGNASTATQTSGGGNASGAPAQSSAPPVVSSNITTPPNGFPPQTCAVAGVTGSYASIGGYDCSTLIGKTFTYTCPQATVIKSSIFQDPTYWSNRTGSALNYGGVPWRNMNGEYAWDTISGGNICQGALNAGVINWKGGPVTFKWIAPSGPWYSWDYGQWGSAHNGDDTYLVNNGYELDTRGDPVPLAFTFPSAGAYYYGVSYAKNGCTFLSQGFTQTVGKGQSATFYSSPTAPAGGTCAQISQQKTCQQASNSAGSASGNANGTTGSGFDGSASYSYSECTDASSVSPAVPSNATASCDPAHRDVSAVQDNLVPFNLTFQWSPVSDADGYTVSATDSQGTALSCSNGCPPPKANDASSSPQVLGQNNSPYLTAYEIMKGGASSYPITWWVQAINAHGSSAVMKQTLNCVPTPKGN